MGIAGVRGTGTWGTDERPKNFRESILWMQPNGSAPIFALTGKLKSESLDDPQTSWWQETLGPVRMLINNGANYNSAATTLAVDNGDATDLVPGDLLLVGTPAVPYTNEIIKVSSVTNATTIVVTRGAAGTTAAAINDNTPLLRIGSSHAEGSGSPSVVHSNPTKYTNYTQIFKTAYEVTETAKATNARTGDPIANDRKRKMFVHSEKIEWSILFGKASEVNGSTGTPERTMGGILSMLTSNVAAGGTWTEDQINDWLASLFNWNADESGDERIVFSGNAALNYLNKIARGSSRITFAGVVTLYGMNLTKWIIPQGTIYIKSHPLFNVTPGYSNAFLVLTPAGIKWRPLKGRDGIVKKNIQANDQDTQKDMWLTEATIELHNERTMGYVQSLGA